MQKGRQAGCTNMGGGGFVAFNSEKKSRSQQEAQDNRSEYNPLNTPGTMRTAVALATNIILA